VIINSYIIRYTKNKSIPLFHFLQQISPFATDWARRPCRAGWLEKNHPRFAPVFFSAKPCTGHWQRTAGPV